MTGKSGRAKGKRGKASAKPAMRSWIVPVRQTLRGIAIVEAEDASCACAQAAAGNFDMEPGAEMTDWEVMGPAKEDR